METPKTPTSIHLIAPFAACGSGCESQPSINRPTSTSAKQKIQNLHLLFGTNNVIVKIPQFTSSPTERLCRSSATRTRYYYNACSRISQ